MATILISAAVVEVTYETGPASACIFNLSAPITKTASVEAPIARTIPTATVSQVTLYPVADGGGGWTLLTPATPVSHYDKIKNVTYDTADPSHIGTNLKNNLKRIFFSALANSSIDTDPTLPSDFGTATSIAGFYACNPVDIAGSVGVGKIGVRFQLRVTFDGGVTGAWASPTWKTGTGFLNGGAEEAVAMPEIAFSETLSGWGDLLYTKNDVRNLQMGVQSQDLAGSGWLNGTTEMHLMRWWAIVTYATDTSLSAPITQTISLTSAVDRSAPTVQTINVTATISKTINVEAAAC
jgi:hypothetical protein